MKKPELLAPAGSYERAKIAYLYGADAVYAGTADLSLRTRVNIGNDEFVKIVELAKKMDKKIYAALNIYAFDKEAYYQAQDNYNNATITNIAQKRYVFYVL